MALTLLLQLTLLMSLAVLCMVPALYVMERSMEVTEETGMPQALPREVCWSVDTTLTFLQEHWLWTRCWRLWWSDPQWILDW